MRVTIEELRALGASKKLISALLEAEFLKHQRRLVKDRDRKREARKAAKASELVRGHPRTVRGQSKDGPWTQTDAAGQTPPVAESTATQAQGVVGVDNEEQAKKQLTDDRVLPPTTPLSPRANQIEQSLFADLEVRSLRARESKRRATRIPPDWQPDLDGMIFAREQLREDRIPNEVLKFRNYWLARGDSRAVSTNWSLNWQNWCLKAREDKQTNGGGDGQLQTDRRPGGAVRMRIALARQRAANGHANRPEGGFAAPVQSGDRT